MYYESFLNYICNMNKVDYLHIDQSYFSAIGHFFSPIVLSNIEKNHCSLYLSEVCYNSGLLKKIGTSITLGNFLDLIFYFLLKNYRNEYVYKNVIANKILLGKHSLSTSQMLTEFRIGKNKADVVIINGSSTVYEIKSEYDSFARLDKQIQSYIMAFEYVNIITSPSQVERIRNLLPDNIGILSFTKRNTISTIRAPKSNLENINLDLLFDSLRRNEYLHIIGEFYGHIPNVPNTKIHQVSKKLYLNIPLVDAIHLTNNVLKYRNNSNSLNDYIDRVPYSIVAYILGIGNRKDRIKKIIDILGKELREFI